MTITEALVSRLVAEQFPQWAGLPVSPVEPGGWDNATFRLGDDMSVRLPTADRYVPQVDKEHRWLPFLGPRLPRRVPEPVARGGPGCGLPRPWSIYRWLEGERVTGQTVADLEQLASDVAGFLIALHGIDTEGGPPPGEHNFFRGGPLATYDGETREAIEALGDTIDTRRATEVWDAALAASWTGAPVWVHGDLGAENLLVVDGRLNAVIDFGCLGVGDPACDLTMAWTFLSGASRTVFCDRLPFDPGTWARARGWGLWKELVTRRAA